MVNLDRDVDKWTSVSERLEKTGIAFERFPAVYGRSLSHQDKRISLNRFRVWCAIGRPLQDGELGCALSHIDIYRKMMVERISCACVLEDDVVFDARLPQQMEMVESFLCTDSPRVVLLSDRTHQGLKEWEILPAERDFGTFAYAINLSAARAILKANFPVQRPCDHWHVWRRHHLIELYHAYPTVCDYDHSAASATAPTFLVAALPLSRRIFHKAKRVIGKTLDSVLLYMDRFHS